MKFQVYMFLVLLGCDRKSDLITAEELKSIIGEEVTCFSTYEDSGYICRSDSKKTYYCPQNKTKDCFYTPRLILLDAPVEKNINSTSK